MKQSSKKNFADTADLYCRLNCDDNINSESNNIQSQKKILKKASKGKGYTDTIFFLDDSITSPNMKLWIENSEENRAVFAMPISPLLIG